MTSLSVNKVLQSEERWLSSESSYCGFDSRSRQCEGPFFCSSESGIVPGSPSCAQYALRSLRTLKWGPMSTFRWIFTNKLLRMSFWQMSFWRMMHNSSRIIQMMTVAAPNGRRKERTDILKLQQVAQQASVPKSWLSPSARVKYNALPLVRYNLGSVSKQVNWKLVLFLELCRTHDRRTKKFCYPVRPPASWFCKALRAFKDMRLK